MDCVEWGTVSLMNKNNPFSGVSFNLFLMTKINLPNVINLGKATSGIKRITWSHTGDGVFSVTPIDTKGKPKFPLFLKIGNYSGTVMLPSGTQYFEVKADGPWNYSIK